MDADLLRLTLNRFGPQALQCAAAVSHEWRTACRHAIQTRRRDFSLGLEKGASIGVDAAGAAPGHFFPAAIYIAECVGATALTRQRLDRAKTVGCDCAAEQCGTAACRCCAGSCAYDAHGRLRSLLNKGSSPATCAMPICECSKGCYCDETCCNRVVGRGLTSRLTIFWTGDDRGWGVRAAEPLHCGQFVCEYAGEILSSEEAALRRQRRDTCWRKTGHRPCNYVMTLVEHVGSPSHRRALQTTIDPTERGNVGRYLNHACEPNLELHIVRVGSAVPRAAFFCAREIAKGEELTFHYGSSGAPAAGGAGSDDGSKLDAGCRPCRCGAAGCGGFLPFDSSAV